MSYTNPQDVAHAAAKLGIGIDAFSAIIDNDEFVQALTTHEKDTLIGVLDTLDSMQTGMESRMENVAMMDDLGFVWVGHLSEWHVKPKQFEDSEPCDQPEQQATPCPGTCSECTKQDADEFWADPDFFTIPTSGVA